MSLAAHSRQVFAFYLGAVAVTLLLAPNVLLDAFGGPRTTEVWIRVAGMVVAFLALLPGIRYRRLGVLAAAAVRSGGPGHGAVDVAATRQRPGTVIARRARTR